MKSCLQTHVSPFEPLLWKEDKEIESCGQSYTHWAKDYSSHSSTLNLFRPLLYPIPRQRFHSFVSKEGMPPSPLNLGGETEIEPVHWSDL